jgi:hypothetical protein
VLFRKAFFVFRGQVRDLLAIDATVGVPFHFAKILPPLFSVILAVGSGRPDLLCCRFDLKKTRLIGHAMD